MNFVLVILEVGQSFEGEDDGGDEDAGNGDGADDPGKHGGVRVFKGVPQMDLETRGPRRKLLLTHVLLWLLPLQLVLAFHPPFEAARIKGSFRNAPVGEVSHEGDGAAVVGDVEDVGAVEVEDAHDVVVPIVEEDLIVVGIVAVTEVKEVLG